MRAELWPALNLDPFLGRPARYVLHLASVTSVYLHNWETRASPARTPPRILLPPLETWACHAKALPYRLLLRVRGETQKEAEQLKKANTFFLFFFF